MGPPFTGPGGSVTRRYWDNVVREPRLVTRPGRCKQPCTGGLSARFKARERPPMTRASPLRSPLLDPSHTPQPLRGHAIDLVVAGGWRLPVRVGVAITAGELELEPLSEGAGMPGGVTHCPAALEWRSARGLVRREGELTLRGDRLVLAAADEAVIMQRRNFARVRCAVRVAVMGTHAGDELITRTVDLSVGGMLVEHAALLSIEERVRFSILLPDLGELQGGGEIVRATPFGHRAVQFDPMPRSDEQRLARYVMAQEREGRSAAAYT